MSVDEASAFGRDQHVAREGELQATRGSDTVDRADDRLRDRAPRMPERYVRMIE